MREIENRRRERHILLKLAEELSELSVEVLHCVNKPKKENLNEIFSEIKDVQKWILKFKELKN